MKAIIENTEEARYNFGYRYGSERCVITDEDIEALKNGKCLAFDINDDEYVAFVYKE